MSLGTNIMRPMIGRYKGFRCARMVAGVKGVELRPSQFPEAVLSFAHF